MIHEQEKFASRTRFYAYCACGVCGPLRWTLENARRDEEAHASVCREKHEAQP